MKTNKGFIGIGLIVTIIAVLAVAGGGYAVWKHTADNKAEVKVENKVEVKGDASVTPSGKKMAFSQFIKQKGSYECDVHQFVGDVDTKGKVFISNGKIRANFNTEANGSEITGSVIIRDGFAYTWTSFFPTGFKVAVKEDADGNLEGNVTADGKQYNWNANKIGDYDCVTWTADPKQFEVPATITFNEIK